MCPTAATTAVTANTVITSPGPVLGVLLGVGDGVFGVAVVVVVVPCCVLPGSELPCDVLEEPLPWFTPGVSEGVVVLLLDSSLVLTDLLSPDDLLLLLDFELLPLEEW